MRDKLFNFEHDFVLPEKFSIGPFIIYIEKEHLDNVKLMPKGEKYTLIQEFRTNYQHNRYVKTIPKVTGTTNSWFETAIVEIEGKDIEPSIFFAEETKKTNFDDLCLLLSFFTGRRVCKEDELEYYVGNRYFDKIVSTDTIKNFKWDNIYKIKDSKLDIQFYNTVLAYDNKDVLGIFAYANSALNIIYERWCKENKFSAFAKNDKKIITKAHEYIINLIKKHLFYKMSNIFIKFLLNEGIDEFIIKDINERLRFVSSSPSAVYKLEKFLINCELCPQSDKSHEFIQNFNRIRNSFVHSGGILSSDKTEEIKLFRSSCFLALLTLKIVQFYISYYLLDIKDTLIYQMKKSVFTFFETGKYMGHDVLNQTFDEYLKEVKTKWENEGKYIFNPK